MSVALMLTRFSRCKWSSSRQSLKQRVMLSHPMSSSRVQRDKGHNKQRWLKYISVFCKPDPLHEYEML